MLRIGMFLADRYEIVEMLGAGGMAEVYRAKCHKLNRFVALKVLKPEFAADKVFVTKFRMEARSVACLTHNNIVGVYDVGEDRGIHFIVMEFVDGITLKDYISRKGKLTTKETIGISLQVAQGLAAAHANHIIHRDVKPQNIMISREGKVKVTDFGIARAITDETTNMYTAMGSVHYISPEQARGGYCDERSDIYSLGITMYEMVTGRVPFEGDNTVSVAVAHINDALIPPSYYTPSIPVALEQIIFKCTQKKPERRYLTCSELIGDLRKAISMPQSNFVESIPESCKGDTITITNSEVDKIRYNGQKQQLSDQDGNSYAEEDAETYAEDASEDIYEYAAKREEDDENEIEQTLFDKVIFWMGVSFAVILLILLVYIVGTLAGWFGNRTRISSGKSTEIQVESLNQKQTTMPDVLGKTKEEAEKLLKEKNLEYFIQEKGEYSEDYPEDTICRQEFKAGTVVNKNTRVKLVMSLGNKAYEITDKLIGMTRKELEQELKDYELDIDYEYKEDPDEEPGTVIEVSPSSGKLKAGDKLKVYVVKELDEVTVPDLREKTKEKAEQELKKAGLKLGVITEEYDNTVDNGLVCKQNPKANTRIEEGAEVDIVISKGANTTAEETVMPRVIFLNQEEAVRRLQELGLKVKIEEKEDQWVEKGYVIDQDPTEGATLRKGSLVTLKVSTGPTAMTPSATPDISTTPSTVPLQSSSAPSAVDMVLTNDFYSMNQPQIAERLQQMGVGAVIQMQFYNTVPSGLVACIYRGNQELRPGAVFNRGETVRVIISGGPEPSNWDDVKESSTQIIPAPVN
ncbi:MAG: Stk1 family PASTA domain-containing Ser/Thr kinase [Candidatus Fimimorpha sp.]